MNKAKKVPFWVRFGSKLMKPIFINLCDECGIDPGQVKRLKREMSEETKNGLHDFFLGGGRCYPPIPLIDPDD